MGEGERLPSTKRHTWQNAENDGKSAEKRSAQPPKCPECDSDRIWKAGFRYLKDGSKVQRWLCRTCGYRFSDSKVKLDVASEGRKLSDPVDDNLEESVVPFQVSSQPFADGVSFLFGEDSGVQGKSKVTVAEKHLNTFRGLHGNRQVCVKEAKNLTQLKETEELGDRSTQEERKGKVVEFLWYLKREGYAQATIKSKTSIFKRLVKDGIDIMDPEQVKSFVARHGDEWSDGYKRNIIDAYQNFVDMTGLSWNPPEYKQVDKLPFIPHEEEIDALVSGCGQKVATSLQLLKETGMRIGEAWNLEWTDVDVERRTVKCTPEKHGNPRMFKVTEKLIAMLQRMPKNNQYVFGNTSLAGHRSNYSRQKKRLAKKLQNPRLEKITFHTLRHWKATMEYHKTKDILHVKQLLGHKSIQSTMKYTQLVSFDQPDRYKCRIAESVEEAKELVEAGFEYVTDVDHKKLFRKPK